MSVSRSGWRSGLAVGVGLGIIVAWLNYIPSAFGVLVAGVLLLSLWMMHCAVGLLDLRRITFPAFWFLLYLATVLVPGLVVASERQHANEPAFLFSIVITLLTVPGGMLVVNFLTGFKRGEIRDFFARPLTDGPRSLHWLMLYWGAVLLGVLLVLQYLREVPSIPLLYMLRHPGAAAEVVLLREDSFKLLKSPLLYFYDVLRRVGFPILVAIAFGEYLRTRRRGWLVAFVAVLLVGVTFASLSLAKAPVALIALIGCFYWYLHKGGRLSLRALLGGMSVVLLFPLVVLLRLSANADVTVLILLQAILRRLFVLPAQILYAYFEIFPRSVAFLHGRTIGRVAWLMGEPVFDLSNYAFTYVFPGGVDSGAAPAAFIGFFYADFGLPGVVLGGVLAGALMQLVQVYLIRRRKTVLGLAAYAFMYWAFWQINLAALPQTMLSGGVAFVLAWLWLFDAGERALQRATAPPAVSSVSGAG